jgi:hypothetical protein
LKAKIFANDDIELDGEPKDIAIVLRESFARAVEISGPEPTKIQTITLEEIRRTKKAERLGRALSESMGGIESRARVGIAKRAKKIKASKGGGRKSTWTEDEDAELLDLLKTKKVPEIAKIMSKKTKDVYNRKYRLETLAKGKTRSSHKDVPRELLAKSSGY